jgi:hypothetical protein
MASSKESSNADAQITELIAQAERLVESLSATVVTMKMTLASASTDIQVQKAKKVQNDVAEGE